MTEPVIDISLPRFYFEKSCWCPTLDISRFVTHKNYRNIRVLWMEEMSHRIVFLPTETRLWMAWMEFLTNIEFASILEEAKKLQITGESFVLHVPLDLNMTDGRIPQELRLRIKYLIYACRAICQLQKTCEPVVESLSIPSLEIAVEREPSVKPIVNQLIRKKIEKYQLEETYPKVKKLFHNIGWKVMEVSSYVFGPFSSRMYVPPLFLSNSLKDFNAQNFQNITRKFLEILDLFGQDYCKITFHKFLENNRSKLSDKRITSMQLDMISLVLDELNEIASKSSSRVGKHIDEKLLQMELSRMRVIIENSVSPMFVPLVLWEAIRTDEFRKNGLNSVLVLGIPSLHIEEDIETGIEIIKETNLDPEITKKLKLKVPWRDSFWSEGTYFAYNLADLKYFFLTSKWTNLYKRNEDGDEFSNVLLDGLDFKIV